MSPNTLELLHKVRLAKGRPASSMVFVQFGDYLPSRESWVTCAERSAQVDLPPDARVDLLDLRCLVGLSVVLFAHRWTDVVGRLVERIKQASPRSLLVCLDDAMAAMKSGSFGGFAWLPAAGDLSFDEWCDAGCGGRRG